MRNSLFSIADVDGTFCIVVTSSDYAEPRLVSSFYPTKLSTHDVVRFYEMELAELSELAIVTKYFDGYFKLDLKSRGMHHFTPLPQDIQLTDGGKTLPIKTEFKPYPAPKCRKRVEYQDGHWHKETAKGWIRCE